MLRLTARGGYGSAHSPLVAQGGARDQPIRGAPDGGHDRRVPIPVDRIGREHHGALDHIAG